MENAIIQIASNATALAVVVAVVWWRVGRLDKSIDKLWAAMDRHTGELAAHQADRNLHPDPDRLKRVEKILNGRRKSA